MAKRFNSVWPPPVYCAQFADGSTMRMSFATPAGKPLDYARGRRLCCAIRGHEQAVLRPGDPGYFESIEYRKVLRHYAQRLIDDCTKQLCLAPERYEKPVYEGEGGYGPDGCGEWRPAKLIGHQVRLRLITRTLPLFRDFLPGPAPASDIVDGWIEKGDETFPDPYFAPETPAAVVELRPKRRAQTDLEKALTLLARLSADERAVLAERMAA